MSSLRPWRRPDSAKAHILFQLVESNDGLLDYLKGFDLVLTIEDEQITDFLYKSVPVSPDAAPQIEEMRVRKIQDTDLYMILLLEHPLEDPVCAWLAIEKVRKPAALSTF